MKYKFNYIDRKRRLTARLLQVTSLVLTFIFFFLFQWIYIEYGEKDITVFEWLFGINEIWRVVGWIGFLISFVVFISIPRLVPFRNGQIYLSKEKIEVISKKINQSFEIRLIEELKVIKDLPYEGDERYETEVATQIIFCIQNLKYDFEIEIFSLKDFENLTPIFKHWQDVIKLYKVEYKI
nr:hypothetical protein [uncultured Carboxylicivirga sp.]